MQPALIYIFLYIALSNIDAQGLETPDCSANEVLKQIANSNIRKIIFYINFMIAMLERLERACNKWWAYRKFGNSVHFYTNVNLCLWDIGIKINNSYLECRLKRDTSIFAHQPSDFRFVNRDPP